MSRGLADASKTHRASKSLDFFTANGITSATEVCDDKLPVLGERVQAYVLDDTPSVLSLGARCMKKGYGFYWHPYELPYFICRDGTFIQLELDNYVPKLPSMPDECEAELDSREVLVPWPTHVVVPATGADLSSDEEDSSDGSDSDDGPGEPEVAAEEDESPPAVQQGPVKEEVDRRPRPPTRAEPEEEIPESKRRLLREQAQELSHLLNHKPFNPYCDGCNAAKMRDVQHFRGAFDREVKAWGDFSPAITSIRGGPPTQA